MKLERKRLEISVDYGDPKEAVKCLESVIRKLKQPRTNYGRETIGQSMLDWGIHSNEFQEYKIQIINDKECMVIPSKMNKS